MAVLLLDTAYTRITYSVAKRIAMDSGEELCSLQSSMGYRLYSPTVDHRFCVPKPERCSEAKIAEFRNLLSHDDAIILEKMSGIYGKAQNGVDLLDLCCGVYELLEAKHKEHEFTTMVLFNDVRIMHFVAVVFARKHNIRALVMELGTRRPGSFLLEEIGVNGRSKAAERYLESGLGRQKFFPWTTAISGNHRGISAKLIFVLFLLVTNVEASLKPYIRRYHHQKFSVKRYVALAFDGVMKRLRGKSSARPTVSANALTKRPKVLIALQLESDTNFQLYADFESNFEFIDKCLGVFDESSWDICIRPHPLDPANYKRFRNKLNAFPPNDADVIVTINSTLGFEQLDQKPVVTAGRCFYQNFTTRLDEIEIPEDLLEDVDLSKATNFKNYYENEFNIVTANFLPDQETLVTFLQRRGYIS